MNEDTILEKSQVNKFFKNLKQLSVNNKCADCCKPSPIWVTITYGLFICSDCASKHREMGVLKSKVKSTLFDKWKVGELRRVWVGGNEIGYKLGNSRDIFLKYKSAEYYVEDINELVAKNIEYEGFSFLECKSNVNNVISQEVKEVALPKFRDDCAFYKEEAVVENSIDIKKKDAFVIKKKSLPTLSKNKKYEIEDESRLGFLNK